MTAEAIVIKDPTELAQAGYVAAALATLEDLPAYPAWRQQLDFWIEALPGLRTPRNEDGSGGTPPRPHQLRHAAVGLQRRNNFFAWTMGTGKCLGKGTGIIMADGSIKKVEDIVVGDQLMGPDSKPRNVLSLARGREMMYRVTSTKGDTYVVNESHILSLKRSGQSRINGVPSGKWKSGDVVNISVCDFLKYGSNTRKNTFKQYKVGVTFPERKVPLDPYFIGLWLGDGSSNTTAVTTADPEIVQYLEALVATNPALAIRVESQLGNQSSTYHISSGSKFGGPGRNPMLNAMKDLDLINNKHIPDLYKVNSREVRLQVLAGLVDSDGYLENGRSSYSFTFKSEQLANDLVFLARSLGFACYTKPVQKWCVYKGERRTGTYHHVSLWGYTESIPVRLDRKHSNFHTGFKDPLVAGISLEALGEGDYYGFTIDGDHLFLLDNFVVTHNTALTALMILGWFGRPLFRGMLEKGQTSLDLWLDKRGPEATGAYLRSRTALDPGTIQIFAPRRTLNLVWMREFARMNLDWAAEVITSEAQMWESTAPIWLMDLNDFAKGQTRKGLDMKAEGRGQRLDEDGSVYFGGHNIAKLIAKRYKPALLVLDEAHRIKNKSERRRAMKIIRRRSRRTILLTGTPMDGWVRDAAKLLGFCYGQETVAYPLSNKDFAKRFTKTDIIATDIATGKEAAERKQRPVPGVNHAQIPAFIRATAPLMHRLTFADPEVGAHVKKPPVIVHKRIIQMDPDHAAFYELRHKQGIAAIKAQLVSGDRSFKGRLNMLTLLNELRMASLCPWVLGYDARPTTALIEEVKAIVAATSEEGRKALLGTTYVQEGRFIHEALQLAGIQGIRLYPNDPTMPKGFKSQSAAKQEALIERFLDEDKDRYLSSNKELVAEGLNMAEAVSVLVSCSQGWRGTIEEQWRTRVERPGQLWPHVDRHVLINGNTSCVYVDQMLQAKVASTASLIDLDFADDGADYEKDLMLDAFEMGQALAERN